MNIKGRCKLKQGVDLVFTDKSNESDDDNVVNKLYGLVDTGSDYNDLL